MKLTTALLVGTTLSSGMGEQPGLEGKLQASYSRATVEVLGSSSDKYTGAGWILRSQLDLRLLGPLFVGGAFSARNGGDWTKDVTWARAGINLAGIGPFSLALEGERALHSHNEELRGSLCWRFDWRDLRIESKTSFTSHSTGLGVSQSIYTGVTF